MNVIMENRISNLLFQARRTEKTFNLVVQELGAYSKEGEVIFYIAFQGKEIDKHVQSGKYDSIYEFTDFYYQWLNKEFTKEQTVLRIQTALNDWFSK